MDNNQTQPNNNELFDALEPKHQKAIEMRYKGKTFAEIAADPEINVNRPTVNLWFLEGGVLHNAYAEYKAFMAKERQSQFEAAQNMLQEMALEAMLVVRVLMQKEADSKTQADSDKNKLNAAQDVLDRILGKKQSLDITSGGKAITALSYDELVTEAVKHGIDVSRILTENTTNQEISGA